MNFIDKLRGKSYNHSSVVYHYKGDVIKTTQNLSVTPAQMFELAAKGIPITQGNVDNFFDGTENPSWDIPLYKQRNVDMSELWQAQQSAKKVVSKFKKEVKK